MVKRKSMSLLAITLVTAVAVSGCSTKTDGVALRVPHSQPNRPMQLRKRKYR